jgi:hypothetical protein
MNHLRSAFAYLLSNCRSLALHLWSNRRSIAICTLIAILVLILFQDRNRNRFVHVGDSDGAGVLDTRTGQLCDSTPQSNPSEGLPKCFDLAKSWR